MDGIHPTYGEFEILFIDLLTHPITHSPNHSSVNRSLTHSLTDAPIFAHVTQNA